MFRKQAPLRKKKKVRKSVLKQNTPIRDFERINQETVLQWEISKRFKIQVCILSSTVYNLRKEL